MGYKLNFRHCFDGTNWVSKTYFLDSVDEVIDYLLACIGNPDISDLVLFREVNTYEIVEPYSGLFK